MRWFAQRFSSISRAFPLVFVLVGVSCPTGVIRVFFVRDFPPSKIILLCARYHHRKCLGADRDRVEYILHEHPATPKGRVVQVALHRRREILFERQRQAC